MTPAQAILAAVLFVAAQLALFFFIRHLEKPMSDFTDQVAKLTADLTAAQAEKQADAATIAGLQAQVASAAADKASALAAQAAEMTAALAPVVSQADALAGQQAPVVAPTPPVGA